jgi:hypothetical protein
MHHPEDKFGVLKLKGREWQKFSRKRKKWWVETAFAYWRLRGFPYIEMTAKDIAKEFQYLSRIHPEDNLAGGMTGASTVGLRLANYFHPQMWSVRVSKYRTPLECFNDDESLKRCIVKALNFWPNSSSLNAQCIRAMMRIYKNTRRVSNFRPVVARTIYSQYSKDGDTICDFSAGYGGRLLGCLTLHRTYIGIEPCSEQVIGLRRMIYNLNDQAKGTAFIYQDCAEDFLPTLKSESVALVFSSPPYFDHERYSIEPTQSYIRYPSYTQWRQHFLEKIIYYSYIMLKHGGFFIINVSDPKGYSIVQDTMSICEKYFQICGIIKLLMHKMPQQRYNSNNAFKSEPILVFKKST